MKGGLPRERMELMDKVYAGAMEIIWRRGIHREPGDPVTHPPKENEGASVPPDCIERPTWSR